MATEKLVKLKSRVGNHEIEIEGPRSDVEQLMKAWWLSVAADTGQPQRRTSESDIKAVSKKSRLSSRTPNEDSAESENNGGIDPHRIAMAMKEDSRSALFEKKILHGLDNWQKIALVLWYVDQPLTS